MSIVRVEPDGLGGGCGVCARSWAREADRSRRPSVADGEVGASSGSGLEPSAALRLMEGGGIVRLFAEQVVRMAQIVKVEKVKRTLLREVEAWRLKREGRRRAEGLERRSLNSRHGTVNDPGESFVDCEISSECLLFVKLPVNSSDFGTSNTLNAALAHLPCLGMANGS